MTVKARIENGEVVVYDSNSPKPFQIIEGYENDFIVGVSYWGGESLTEEEWESFGFYPYTKPKYDTAIQTISEITFNTTDNIFEATVVDIEWSSTLEEMKVEKIQGLKYLYNQKLSETDWVIIRDKELNQATDQSILDSRAALRTECSSKETEVNALTTKRDIALYEL